MDPVQLHPLALAGVVWVSAFIGFVLCAALTVSKRCDEGSQPD